MTTSEACALLTTMTRDLHRVTSALEVAALLVQRMAFRIADLAKERDHHRRRCDALLEAQRRARRSVGVTAR